MAIFSRWTWVSWYQNVSILDFIGAKDEGDGGDNWSCKVYKANSHYQQTNIQLSTGQMPFLSPNQQCEKCESTQFIDINMLDFHLWNSLQQCLDILTVADSSEEFVTHSNSNSFLTFSIYCEPI